MPVWEYKVVPAPTKGVKAPGVKGQDQRFANAIEVLMNDMAASGWEYQRAETLPSIERAGLTGSTTEWRNLLVFRRAKHTHLEDFERELLAAPTPPMSETQVETVIVVESEDDQPPEAVHSQGEAASDPQPDAAIEDGRPKENKADS